VIVVKEAGTAALPDEAKIIHKLRIRIIPFVFVLYIVSFLDRINISFAALTMNMELAITSKQLAWVAGIFFFGYFLFEIPSNLLRHKIGARIWIACILITWGFLATLSGLVHSVHQLYVVRFLLRLAEAGYFPGIALYLTYWFRRRDQVALFLAGIPVTSILGAAVTLLIVCWPYPALAQKTAPPKAAEVAQAVREYRMDNEDRIIRELSEFLSIPNIASDTPNIQKNAAHLVEMLEARGIETHLLPITGRGPVVFGKLISAEAKRTVIFYAHYDGQPVDPAAWTDGKPFEPVLRDGAIEAGGKRIPFPENSAQHRAVYNDEWRIYARSSSDDKSPIVALLAAIDALRTKKIPLAVNLKVIFEGEEEAGSTNLQRTLELHKNLLGADLLITADGPVHQSGRPLVFFGNRGDIGIDITVFGPVRALHSGHYGNWAPNPAMELSRLLASMKDADGRVLIDGYYDDVTPLGDAEKKALAEMPANDADLERELGIAKPEGRGKKLVELIMEPSLNIRGLRSAYVGEQAQNVVPDRAEASLDARLVRGEDPEKKFDQIAAFIRKQGYYVIDHEPTMDERRAQPLIAKVVYGGGYRASRTPMDLPVSKALVQVVQGATGNTTVVAPTLGGSVPMYIFEDLGLPWIGVPIVNYDNHQHSSDENLRLGHLWRGIEIYGAILADLNW
jgi:acetylornithine deacetylase/succinyl-diaminopimelate desuccinylase-like protein